MEQGCILDSNVVIYFLEGALNSSGKLVVDKATAAGAKISIISKIELLSRNPPQRSNIDRVQTFIEDSIALPSSDAVVK